MRWLATRCVAAACGLAGLGACAAEGGEGGTTNASTSGDAGESASTGDDTGEGSSVAATSGSEGSSGEASSDGADACASPTPAGCREWELPLDGAPHDLVLADGLAVVNVEDERLLAVRTDSGAIEIDLAMRVDSAAVNATDVFWADQNVLYRLARAGGDATPIVEMPAVCATLAATSTELFCVGGGDVSRVDVNRGMIEAIASSSPSNLELVVDGEDVYFVSGDTLTVMTSGAAEPTYLVTIGFVEFAVGGGAAYIGLGTAIERIDLQTMASTQLPTPIPADALYAADDAGRVLFGTSDLSLTNPDFTEATSLGVGGVLAAAADEDTIVAVDASRTLIGIARDP